MATKSFLYQVSLLKIANVFNKFLKKARGLDLKFKKSITEILANKSKNKSKNLAKTAKLKEKKAPRPRPVL